MRTLLLVGALLAQAQAYVRTTTSAGVPLRRGDADAIRFLVNDSTAAGMTNADGEVVITQGSDPMAALNAAAATWSSVPSSIVKFAPLETTSASAKSADLQHVITFQDSPEIRSVLGRQVLALTFFAHVNGTVVDSDVVFNPAVSDGKRHYAFSTTGDPDAFDLQSVATHELGHALGSSHTNLKAAAMFFSTPPGKTLQARLGADDVAFLTDVYPAPGMDSAFATIQGKITFEGGAAVRGAMLVAVDPATGAAVSALSHLEEGTFTIMRIPPGNYLLYAEPLDGPTYPLHLGLRDDAVDVAFQPAILGGAAAPQILELAGGATASADLTVLRGAPPVKVKWVGIGRPECSGDAREINNSAVTLAAGQAVDLVLYGAGLDGEIPEVRLLGAGVAIRPDSVRVDPLLADRPLRVTVDVAPDAGPVDTILIVKGDLLAPWSAGVAVVPPPAQ